MSADMNKVLLIGKVTGKPTLVEGDDVVDVEVQTGEDLHRVRVRGVQGRVCLENLRQGSLVYVEGSLKPGLIVASQVHFLRQSAKGHFLRQSAKV